MKELSQLKVLIVGLGQMGGSLGLDLVKRRLVAEVVGFDLNETVVTQAKKMGAVDNAANSLGEKIKEVDLVILAVPIREIVKLIPFIAQHIRKNALIFDVGSTKVEILKKVSQLRREINYIGGHPLAGSEKPGLEAAELNKFAHTTFVLVPFPGTKPKWVERAKQLIRGLDAKPLIMTALEHDRLIALTSHLPYLFAVGLLHLAAEYENKCRKIWDLIGGSFKSATRVAASPPELTLDMFLTNQKNVMQVIDEMVAELSHWKQMIEKQNEGSLRILIEQAQKKRKVFSHG